MSKASKVDHTSLFRRLSLPRDKHSFQLQDKNAMTNIPTEAMNRRIHLFTKDLPSVNSSQNRSSKQSFIGRRKKTNFPLSFENRQNSKSENDGGNHQNERTSSRCLQRSEMYTEKCRETQESSPGRTKTIWCVKWHFPEESVPRFILTHQLHGECKDYQRSVLEEHCYDEVASPATEVLHDRGNSRERKRWPSKVRYTQVEDDAPES